MTNVSAQPVSIQFELPPIDMVDHQKKKFTNQDLLGKVTVVDFIFTTCGSVCPRLTKTMGEFQKGFVQDSQVAFLSITVDPENDTPEKLAEFAAGYPVDAARWRFVTGEPEHVEKTVIKGFKMALRPVGPGVIDHAERFVTVDKQGRVRGVFETDPAGLKKLEAKIAELKAE